jgi:hypothetical protein
VHGLKIWAVVPVKALSSSKQRLALALGPRREAFARALLTQTLFALAGSRLVAGVLVVTADPEVADEARQAGADVLQEEADLNTACAHGLAEIRARGGDICAFFHADLALLTPRGVDNPEAPWPEIERLHKETALAGKFLTERLTIYPSYARAPDMWLDPAMRRSVLELSDGSGHGRDDYWRAGRSAELPLSGVYGRRSVSVSKLLTDIIDQGAQDIGEDEVERLFEARDSDFAAVCEAADHVRASTVGDVATYVVNRNINYTNICTYGCGFCAFSKGKRNREGAEKPYLLNWMR